MWALRPSISENAVGLSFKFFFLVWALSPPIGENTVGVLSFKFFSNSQGNSYIQFLVIIIYFYLTCGEDKFC